MAEIRIPHKEGADVEQILRDISCTVEAVEVLLRAMEVGIIGQGKDDDESVRVFIENGKNPMIGPIRLWAQPVLTTGIISVRALLEFLGFRCK